MLEKYNKNCSSISSHIPHGERASSQQAAGYATDMGERIQCLSDSGRSTGSQKEEISETGCYFRTAS